MCDSYSQFLGIEPTERPLADWQLLGVRSGERDPGILEEAALQRFDQIRPYVLRYPQEATALLNEIAQALNSLLADIPREEDRVVTRVKHTTVVVAEPVRETDAPLAEAEGAPVQEITASQPDRPAPRRVKTLARYTERPGKMTMLVLCQGQVDSDGSDLSVWQIRLKKMAITDRQRRKLQRQLDRATRTGVRAHVIGQRGEAGPTHVVAALVQKGLGTLRRMWQRNVCKV
jgi:hypothetical protein